MTELEKVIAGLECCVVADPDDYRKCNKCPFEHNGIITSAPCMNGLMAKALALLKAQMPRVMTREEVIATPEGVVVWMEEEAESGTYIQPIVSTGNGCLGNFYIGVGSYGVEMRERRFWTSRPTPEQMASTPWGGGEK